jgi:hypothetical protein
MTARWASIVLVSSFSAAIAQPQEPLIAELEATQRRAAEKSATLREREQAADKAMELRAKVLSAARPDDPRLPAWHLDSAAGELARLARDGSDTATLFALPLPVQKETVKLGAGRALDHLNRAAAFLDQVLKSLEDSPPDDAAKVHADQDRNVRIPFFGARARILLAACASGPERAEHAKAAFDLVGKLSLSSPGPDSIRRVSVGSALLMRAQPADEADLQAALDEFGSVLTSGAGPSVTTRAEAWFGLIAASAGLGKLDALLEQFRPAARKEPFLGPDGKPDPLLAVLAVDAVSRAWAERAFDTRDRAVLDRAVAEQQSLLRRRDLAIGADSLRPLVYQKLSILGTLGTGLDLPPAIDLAAAIEAAREPSRRAEAIKRLRAVADSPDAGDFSGDALWELAVLLTQGSPSREDTLSAVEALSRIARDFEASPRAPEAIAAALAHSQSLARASAADRAPALYRESLRIATTKYTSLPGIDLWRYEYARVLSDREDVPPSDLAEALRALRLVAGQPQFKESAVRLLERVQARVLDGLWTRVRRAREQDQSVLELCRAEVLPEARAAADWAVKTSSPLRDRFRVDFADALTECGDSSGRAIYEDLLKTGAEVPGAWPRLRLGLARAQIIAGETAAAFATLRDLATALDAPSAGGPPRSEIFWHAWTLMLEELSSRNLDGARTGTIRAHIKRLESIDASLGGEPWRTRVGRARDKAK